MGVDIRGGMLSFGRELDFRLGILVALESPSGGANLFLGVTGIYV